MELFQKIVEEYNNGDNPSYGQNAHQNVVELTKGSTNDPSRLTEINMEKAKEAYRQYLLEYEQVFNNWKLSGTHEEMEDNVVRLVTDPLSKFTSTKTLLYFHEITLQHPGLFENACGLLPENVFFESASESVAFTSNKTLSAQKKKSAAAAQIEIMEAYSNKTTSIAEKSFLIAEKKTKVLAKSAAIKNIDTLKQIITRDKKEKRSMIKELVLEKGSRSSAMDDMEAHRERKKARGGAKDPGTPESQASLMDDISEVEQQICYSAKQLKVEQDELTFMAIPMKIGMKIPMTTTQETYLQATTAITTPPAPS